MEEPPGHESCFKVRGRMLDQTKMMSVKICHDRALKGRDGFTLKPGQALHYNKG